MLRRGDMTPLYAQVMKSVREQILAGQWQPGEQIPTEEQLMQQYGVSKITVRQAIALLTEEGLLVKRQGLGTFVTEPKIEVALFKIASFTDMMREKGLHPETRILAVDRVQNKPEIAKELRLAETAPVFCLKRLRSVNGSPVILEASYFPAQLYPGFLDQDFRGRPLYEILLQSYGFRPDQIRQVLEPVLLTPEEARLLQAGRGVRGLLLRRWSYAVDGQPIEYVKALHRADKFKFSVDLSS